jgi:hypothetical protein
MEIKLILVESRSLQTGCRCAVCILHPIAKPSRPCLATNSLMQTYFRSCAQARNVYSILGTFNCPTVQGFMHFHVQRISIDMKIPPTFGIWTISLSLVLIQAVMRLLKILSNSRSMPPHFTIFLVDDGNLFRFECFSFIII